MEISDPAKAETALSRIGYYRLSAYWYPFRVSGEYSNIITREVGVEIYDNFRPGTTLSLVLDLYVFDKRLRMIVMDAIERIEIAVRTFVSLEIGKRGPLILSKQKEPSCKLYHKTF